MKLVVLSEADATNRLARMASGITSRGERFLVAQVPSTIYNTFVVNTVNTLIGTNLLGMHIGTGTT